MEPLTLTILGLVGTAAAAGSVIVSLRNLAEKKKSISRFAKELRLRDGNLLQQMQEERGIKIQELRDELEQKMRVIAKELPKNDRWRIAEGLFQPSEQGRKLYVQKIINLANEPTIILGPSEGFVRHQAKAIRQ
ncbi:MAG: hypothetical protein ACJ8C4_15620 [Gemmataceae bacterium]